MQEIPKESCGCGPASLSHGNGGQTFPLPVPVLPYIQAVPTPLPRPKGENGNSKVFPYRGECFSQRVPGLRAARGSASSVGCETQNSRSEFPHFPRETFPNSCSWLIPQGKTGLDPLLGSGGLFSAASAEQGKVWECRDRLIPTPRDGLFPPAQVAPSWLWALPGMGEAGNKKREFPQGRASGMTSQGASLRE